MWAFSPREPFLDSHATRILCRVQPPQRKREARARLHLLESAHLAFFPAWMENESDTCTLGLCERALCKQKCYGGDENMSSTDLEFMTSLHHQHQKKKTTYNYSMIVRILRNNKCSLLTGSHGCGRWLGCECCIAAAMEKPWSAAGGRTTSARVQYMRGRLLKRAEVSRERFDTNDTGRENTKDTTEKKRRGLVLRRAVDIAHPSLNTITTLVRKGLAS